MRLAAMRGVFGLSWREIPRALLEQSNMFRFFRKKRPTLKPEMIEPADVPISTTEAKRIYRDYLKAYDRDLDARGRAEAVQQFADFMKEREEEYKLAIANKKDGIKDTLSDIKTEILLVHVQNDVSDFIFRFLGSDKGGLLDRRRVPLLKVIIF